ncbi:PaaI family thioesterase [Hoyosella rhizosphaerae]|uniref:Thioesterase domain-containing protein n=1 Tax=Hoyosella rhizosphaerae TaxID=1755582 RepID=A0A916X8K7_9ACTN|nr:PaaI family thioesterase [Hoyosella rhizosphaerae]MBN4926986.1 PaaI family thioesterase [Hoyosella rhizosphaerae]GGC54939.1 hypothetical protein GCM10011410_04160 [Hoyosella rhizosphaerae]
MANQTPDLSAMSGLELLRAMMPMLNDVPNIGRTIGMEVGTLEDGKVEFHLTTKPDHANPLGSVHGGVCATLLDSVMGCAVHTTLDPGVGYSTLELKVNYIRTVPTDGVRLTGTGTVIHRGRSTATAEGTVHDDQGRLVAHATTTCLIHS